MSVFRAKICLPVYVLTLVMWAPAQSFSATYDDDTVEIELEGDGPTKPKSKKSRKFPRPGRKDSANSSRDSSRDRRGDRSSENRSSRRDTGRKQGPANERFGKTKGKIRFVLVDDPTKDPGYVKDEAPVVRKKISLGPGTSFRKTK